MAPDRRKDAAEISDAQLAEMAKGTAFFLSELRKALAKLKRTRAALALADEEDR